MLNAIESFLAELAEIAWAPLGLAIVCHLLKMVVRAQAWRNIVAASYPDDDVSWPAVFGAYAAGVGTNALVPARGGDLLKLYILKHRIPGATYPTLAATLLVETLFDLVVASALVAWALSIGALPGLDVIPHLPEVDLLWLFQNPGVAAALGAILLVLGFVLGVVAGPRVHGFRPRLAQGFAILRTPGRYARTVLPWQALDWALRLATIALMLRAFGIGATPSNVLLVKTAQSLSTVLPLTPGGIGTEQALLFYLLVGEASTSAVFAFSAGFKVVIIVVNALVGFTAIAIMLKTLRWRRAVSGSQA